MFEGCSECNEDSTAIRCMMRVSRQTAKFRCNVFVQVCLTEINCLPSSMAVVDCKISPALFREAATCRSIVMDWQGVDDLVSILHVVPEA